MKTLLLLILSLFLVTGPGARAARGPFTAERSGDGRRAVWTHRAKVAIYTSPVWGSMITGALRPPSPSVAGRALGVGIGAVAGVIGAYVGDGLHRRLRAHVRSRSGR